MTVHENSPLPPAEGQRRGAASSPSEVGDAAAPRSSSGRLWRVLLNDVEGLHFRLRVANAVLFFCPHFCFNRFRTLIYRGCGIRIGPRTLILGRLDLSGGGRIWERLTIGAQCQITTPLYVDLNAKVTIGDNVAIAHQVMLMTTNHEMGSSRRRSGPWKCAPIVIEDGCWIGARATILPGVTVGRGSVVAAGAVVAADVPPDTLVGGVPAKPIRTLSENGQP
jgi:maltose O-acetyltransferase